MSIYGLFKWLLFGQFMFHVADGDGGGDSGDGDGDGGGDGDGQGGDKGGDDNKNTYAETWRADWADGNEKMTEHLSRYSSPSAALTAGYAANLKIASGELKSTSPFPDKGTEDEQKAWRTEHGIPESADKYELGRDVDDADKDLISSMLEFSYGRNATPDQVKAQVDWHYQNQEALAEAQSESDALAKQSTEDTLRAEWNEEYRANINRIQGLLDTAPAGVKDKILNARFPDGTPLGSDPDALKFLIDMAVQINPATTVVPGAGDNIAGAISDELDNLKSLMGDAKGEYWKGPKAEKNQARYRELVGAQNKMKK